MDLGYSSSDSDSDEEHKKRKLDEINTKEKTNPKEELISINVSDIFNIDKHTNSKRRKLDDHSKTSNSISIAIQKVLSDTVVSDDEKKEKHQGDIPTDELDKSPNETPKLPTGVKVTEFNMEEFYKQNTKDIEAGELDAERQDKIGNVTFHNEGGRSGLGRLDRVIQFNLNNEERITFQNKEKIAKEKALAKEKLGNGRA